MRNALPLFVALALVASVVGCAGRGRPPWWSSGTAAYQQERAQRFDPYPESETGPPIDDARPRDFQNPPAEPSRARWLKWGWPPFSF